MSLRLSEFTAKTGAECVCATLIVCVSLWMQAFVGKPTPLLSAEGKQRCEKSAVMQRGGNLTSRQLRPHKHPHIASDSRLMTSLTELTLADEVSAQTQFDSILKRLANNKVK